MEKSESQKHIDLVTDLLSWLKSEKGYRITGADLEGWTQPSLVKNTDKVGDRQDKMPDIDAKWDHANVFVRGEAKTGDGDLETEHTETQFRLFANRQNSENKKDSLLYIIVPNSKYNDLQRTLQRLGLQNNQNVISVRSGKVA